MVGTAGDGVSRATQLRVMVGVRTGVPVNMTQFRAMIGTGGTDQHPAARITQARVMVGVRVERPPCLTQEADLWRIQRTDGVTYRFTSHDRRITFRGEVYNPCGSMTGSALQLSADLGATDNMDLSGIFFEGGISEADLWSDAFDGASVEVWRYPWNGGTPVLVQAGTIGSRVFGDTAYKFEVVTAGEKLSQKPILQPVMPTCRWKFGDSRCGVDVSALAVAGTVTAVAPVNYFTLAQRRTFVDSGLGEPDGKFTLGRLTWTGGDNIGVSVDVKVFANDTFVLSQPVPVPISVGDTYSVTPGCDRLASTCHDTYANKINFGGFEFVRGYDDLNATPDQDI